MNLVDFYRIVNFISVIALSWAAGPKWPSVVKRCSVNDPNLSKCLMKQTQMAIAKLSKGLPAIGLKSLDPLRNVSFDIASNPGAVTINAHTSNVIITGPSKIQLKKVSFDKPTSTYFIEGYHNLIRLTGNYVLKGNVLVVPLDSSGTFEYELRGASANHTIKLSNTVRSGGHGVVRFDLKNFKSMKFIFRDRVLGEQGSATLSTLLNENMDLVSQALWNPMEKVVREVYSAALKPLTSKFNVKDFLPIASSGRSEVEDIIRDDEAVVSDRLHSEKPVRYSYEIIY